MKNIKLLFVLLLLWITPVQAEIFSIGDSVTFNAPQGFTKLSQEEISIKYPSSRAPSFVIGNQTRNVTIAYDLKPNRISADNLEKLKQSFIHVFERIVPGIKWIKKEIIEHDGKNWIFFEMTSRAIDTDIHNIMLVTEHKGKMLVFNFNSTKSAFPQVESQLRKSIKSIRVKNS